MENMTPSVEKSTTESQINKAVSNYRAMIEKHAPEFNSEAVQSGLGHPDLAKGMLAVFRKYVEMFANMIVRLVEGVNRTLTPQQALDATCRTQYTDKDVVTTMPKGEGENAEIIFFNLGRYINDDDLDKEYALRDLKPADAYSLARYNQDNPEFADDKPNCTHWKDGNDKWCYIAFDRWDGDRRFVGVGRDDDDWGGSWWFAGLHK